MARKRGPEPVILYPIYFDKRVSRDKGRRVPAGLAVSSPTAEEIAEAVRAIGRTPLIELEKSHPSTWYKNKGRVLVSVAEDKVPKTEIVRRIAENIKATRQQKK